MDQKTQVEVQRDGAWTEAVVIIAYGRGRGRHYNGIQEPLCIYEVDNVYVHKVTSTLVGPSCVICQKIFAVDSQHMEVFIGVGNVWHKIYTLVLESTSFQEKIWHL